MKKGWVLFLVFCLLFSTASYASVGGAEAQNDVYSQYIKASEELNAADSAILGTTMHMITSVGGETMETDTNGTITAIFGDGSNIQMKMDMQLTGITEEAQSISMYYKDGFAFMEMMGMKVKMVMPVDEFTESANVAGTEAYGFSADGILSQLESKTADGKTELKFTVDKAYMNNLPTGQLDLGVETSDITISDVVITALLDTAGSLESINMIFSASFTVQELAASVDYDMTIDVIQLGDVTIEYPADLDTYMDLSELLGSVQ